MTLFPQPSTTEIVSPHQQPKYRRLEQVNQIINAHEQALQPLYALRAGTVITDPHGGVVAAWCSCCGQQSVRGTTGHKFCTPCQSNLQSTQ